jgi:hypothetical protein
MDLHYLLGLDQELGMQDTEIKVSVLLKPWKLP